MSRATREQLISYLETSQQELADVLNSVSDRQDWQPAPDMWSFRYHAAHLAAAEQEAFWERVVRIASGEQPYLPYYLNTGRDFSQHELSESLHDWAVTRRQIIDFVQALPPDKLILTGTHATFGTITIPDVLQIMHDHDQEHLTELRQMVATCLAQTDSE